jgi:hypothetical protein
MAVERPFDCEAKGISCEKCAFLARRALKEMLIEQRDDIDLGRAETFARNTPVEEEIYTHDADQKSCALRRAEAIDIGLGHGLRISKVAR